MLWGREIVSELENLRRDLLIQRPPIHWVGDTGEPAWGPNFQGFGGGYDNCHFWKTKEGVVHLSGWAKRTIVGAETLIYTLPVGFRPEKAHVYIVSCFPNYGWITVNANGTVISFAGTGPNFWIGTEATFISTRI